MTDIKVGDWVEIAPQAMPPELRDRNGNPYQWKNWLGEPWPGQIGQVVELDIERHKFSSSYIGVNLPNGPHSFVTFWSPEHLIKIDLDPDQALGNDYFD